MIVSAAASTPPCSKRAKLAIVFLICAFALLVFPGGHEAAADDAIEAARMANAQTLFDEGRALLLEGRAQEACPKLEESQRLDPGLGTQLNLADCYERLGKLANARTLFLDVAEQAKASGQEQRERVARGRAAAIEPRLGKLAIVVPADGGAELRVERDGAELGRAQWNVPALVDPGEHRVRAWGPGVGEWVSEVDVVADGVVHEAVVPVNDARAFFDPLHRKLGLVAAGVGVAGVAVGGVFGVRAITKKNEADRAGCDGRTCNTVESGKIRDQARSAGNIATVAMSIGAGGLAAAAVLLWIVSEPSSEGAEGSGRVATLELGPLLVARGGGVWLHGDF
jgi:hypothetical protein